MKPTWERSEVMLQVRSDVTLSTICWQGFSSFLTAASFSGWNCGVKLEYSNTSQLKMLMSCTLFDERIHQGLRKGRHGQSCQLLPPKAPLWTRFYLWTKIARIICKLMLTRDCSSSGNSLVGAKSEREKASQRWPVREGSSKSNWEQRH